MNHMKSPTAKLVGTAAPSSVREDRAPKMKIRNVKNNRAISCRRNWGVKAISELAYRSLKRDRKTRLASKCPNDKVSHELFLKKNVLIIFNLKIDSHFKFVLILFGLVFYFIYIFRINAKSN